MMSVSLIGRKEPYQAFHQVYLAWPWWGPLQIWWWKSDFGFNVDVQSYSHEESFSVSYTVTCRGQGHVAKLLPWLTKHTERHQTSWQSHSTHTGHAGILPWSNLLMLRAKKCSNSPRWDITFDWSPRRLDGVCLRMLLKLLWHCDLEWTSQSPAVWNVVVLCSQSARASASPNKNGLDREQDNLKKYLVKWFFTPPKV